jgi:F-type H+-transporting ATPase subunit b
MNRSALTLAAFAVLLFAPPAWASEAAGGQPKSIFDLPERWDLSIYTVVVFLLLLGLLSKFAWPAIYQGMKNREEMLAAAKTAAEKAKAEAEEMHKKLQAEFASANDKIRLMLEEARRDADELRAKERDAGLKEAAAERDRAKREIETAKDQALTEIYQQSVQLAALMSSKAVRRGMTADDHTRLVDEALSELKAGK